ncbi:helix-turn-helix transcriptional regulator [Pseudomonas sp. ML96]|uniref:AraC family transcriptional regulator n=1 Tax=Pseudomonas sp. ML96 TaxID=1523503 RepID=UPI0005BB7060|nr:helix-turn-helix transcriptional regulator [Pseudomonas sp. ML96]
MSPIGQTDTVARAVPDLQRLPRPLYGRVESLPNRALTFVHSHPWVQLSYAIAGVLEVQTAGARFIAPPQRAVWVPAGVEHRVFSSPRTEMRSLYIECAAVPWGPGDCRVLAVSPLLRELIDGFSALPVEYDEAGAAGRLTAVLLDQLQAAPAVELSLPLPRDARLQAICSGLAEERDRHLGLADWSARLGVSERTLSRLFLRDTGLSFRTWRQRQRLLDALTPLERGERVTDVALACGYDSLSAFIAAFRQQFGATPGEFFRGQR